MGLRIGMTNPEDEMERAKRKQQSDLLLAAIGKAGQQIGGAISGTNPDTEYFDTIATQSAKPIEKLEQKQKTMFDQAGTMANMERKGLVYDPQMGKFNYDPTKDVERQMEREKRALPLANLTPGQKATDIRFAKQYDEWTTSGLPTYEKSMTELRGAITQLKSGENLSGPYLSKVGMGFRPKAKALQQNVIAPAIAGLKSSMGSQFTEKDREVLQSLSYDDSLTEEQNIDKIEKTIKLFTDKAKIAQSKSDYYETNGTLLGWRGPKTEFDQNTGQPPLKKDNGLGINAAYAGENAPPPKINNYTPDVMAYAQKHGITPEKAQEIKMKRGGK